MSDRIGICLQPSNFDINQLKPRLYNAQHREAYQNIVIFSSVQT